MRAITDKLTAELFGELDQTVKKIESLVDRTKDFENSINEINSAREKAIYLVKERVDEEILKSKADLIKYSTFVLKKTADEASNQAPNAYKFRAWAIQGIIICSVAWIFYGAGTFNAAGKFFVENQVQSNTKMYNLTDVSVAGVEVKQLSFDGSTILFIPQSKTILDAAGGKIKKYAKLSNPFVAGMTGIIFGAIATFIYIFSHEIMVGIEKMMHEFKSWFKKQEVEEE